MPPTGRPYSVGDAIGYGWKKFTENIGAILLAMLILVLIGAAINGVQALLQAAVSPDRTLITGDDGFVITTTGGGPAGAFVSLLFSIVTFVWGYLVQAAIARGGLALTEGRQLVFGELLSFDKLGRLILGGLLLGFLVGVGLLLCILPGLVIALFGSFFVYFVLDADLGPIDAIKASFTFVKDNFGNILGLALLSFLIMIVGFLLCFVGVLAAWPIVVIAQAYTYKVLRGQPVAP
jgi:uncharacterized membrane protein